MGFQSVSATIGNGKMSKVFNGLVADGVWTNIKDTISQSNLGILIPRAVVNNVQAEYAAGLMAWRIQNAQTLAVSRRGWGAKEDYSCYGSTMIPPHTVNPDEMIQVYALDVNTTEARTNALAWVTTSKGTELYKAENVANGTATAMQTALQGQSLGDAGFNSTLTELSICLEDGAQLDKVEFIDSSGGVVLTIQGDYRKPSETGGGTSAYYNLKAMGLSLMITKGFSMKITTVSA